MSSFTHLNENGRAKMVDVSAKPDTLRTAVAGGVIHMTPEMIQQVREHGIKKGDVLAVAQVAGIMAAKKTSDLIPMCHPIMISGVDLDFAVRDTEIEAIATVRTTGPTGVEMEALTAVSTALLTIYDMCKALDKGMVIENIHLVSKTGGKSGDYHSKGSPT